jgi:hypothetical protein
MHLQILLNEQRATVFLPKITKPAYSDTKITDHLREFEIYANVKSYVHLMALAALQ